MRLESRRSVPTLSAAAAVNSIVHEDTTTAGAASLGPRHHLQLRWGKARGPTRASASQALCDGEGERGGAERCGSGNRGCDKRPGDPALFVQSVPPVEERYR